MSAPRVKIMQRRPNFGIASMPASRQISFVPNLATAITSGHRKTADGGPIGVIDRIREFITLNKPNINFDPSAIAAAASKVKMPLLALAGITFVAGVAYLAHRLYKHWTEQKAAETIAKIMEDIEASAPQLLKVPGWREQITQEVADAVASGSESEMVSKIAKIKTAIIQKQQSTGHGVGGGIDLFTLKKNGLMFLPTETEYNGRGQRKQHRMGRGYVSPL